MLPAGATDQSMQYRMNAQLLTPANIQQIYRLIHELCEMGADTRAWRHRMMTEMMKLTGATASISYAFKFSLDPNDIGPRTLVYTEVGMNDAWRQYLANGDLGKDPITPHIMQPAHRNRFHGSPPGLG
jgi:hypothetical protein